MSRKLPTCPRCKSAMVARKGKNGDFYGCTSFPKCKFTSKTKVIGGYDNNDFLDNVMPGDFNTHKG